MGGRRSTNLRPPATEGGFRVRPKRWIVGRTFAWLSRCRRLARDWGRLAATTETWVYPAMSRPMTKRLAKAAV
jgi:putative transposase